MYLKYEGLIKSLVQRFRQANAERVLKIVGIQIVSRVDDEAEHPTKTSVEVTFDDLTLPKEYQRHVTKFDVPWIIQAGECQLDFHSMELTLPK